MGLIYCSTSLSRLHLSGFPDLLGSSGLEPPTSRLSGARSNLLSYEPVALGLSLSSWDFVQSWLHVRRLPVQHVAAGDDGIRTHDPLLAGQVLSQLSYTPVGSLPYRSLKIEQQTSVLLLSPIGKPRVSLPQFSLERR